MTPQIGTKPKLLKNLHCERKKNCHTTQVLPKLHFFNCCITKNVTKLNF